MCFWLCNRYNPIFNHDVDYKGSGAVRVLAQGGRRSTQCKMGEIFMTIKGIQTAPKAESAHSWVFCAMQETDRQTEVPDRDCLNLWKDVNCDNKVRINLKIISPLSAMTHNHLAIKIMILLGFTYLITLGFVLKKYSKITGFNAYFYSNYFWHLKIARIAIFPKLQAMSTNSWWKPSLDTVPIVNTERTLVSMQLPAIVDRTYWQLQGNGESSTGPRCLFLSLPTDSLSSHSESPPASVRKQQ